MVSVPATPSEPGACLALPPPSIAEVTGIGGVRRELQSSIVEALGREREMFPKSLALEKLPLLVVAEEEARR